MTDPAVELASEEWWPDGDAGLLLRRAPQRVVAIVGAGISQGAGLPGAAGLAAHLRAQPFATGRTLPESGDPNVVAQELERQGVESLDIRRSASEYFELGHYPDRTVTPEIEALLRLPSGLIVTLNYDRLLEEAGEQRGYAPKSYPPSQMDQFLWDIRDGPDGRLRICHIHGRADGGDGIVLGRWGYTAGGGAAARFLSTLLWQYSALFVGTSLNEQYVLLELGELAPPVIRHVLVTKRCVFDQMTRSGGAFEHGTTRYGIQAVPLPGEGWDQLGPFLVRFAAQPVASFASVAGEPRTAAPAPAAPEIYVPVPLVVHRVEAERDRADLWLFGHSVPQVGGGEVLALPHTLVCGHGGTGKSEFLRALGRQVSAPYRAVLVPLRGLGGNFTGRPEELLSEWAQTGQSFGLESEPVSPEAITSQTFHFLLDGLDELPPDRRPAFVAALNGVADAVPHHRFTLSSRPVDEIEALGPRWARFDLAPGPDWRRAYLEATGVPFDDLVASAPCVADLGELLDVPFYLSGIVGLHRDGRLGEVRQTAQLLGVLIDQAVAELSPRFDREAVRGWLRRVALAMQLEGRPTLPREQAMRIPLPDPAGVMVGAPTALIAELIDRSLFIAEAESVGFVHRHLADALVAEELMREGPDEALLSVIAPPSGDGHAIHAPWEGPLAQVMATDASWRRAVGELVPLAGAIATPDDAPEAERRAAGTLIWRTYREWRIWLHDFDIPRERRPSETLARLLSDPALVDVAEELLRDVGHEHPVVRASAIEVLAGARIGQLVPLLPGILESDPEGVVRRWAASATASLGRTELFPLVLARANAPADDYELQDMLAHAVKLAPVGDRFEVARQLGVRHLGERGRIVFDLRYAGATARECLALWRAWGRPDSSEHDISGFELNALLRDVDAHDSGSLSDVGWSMAVGTIHPREELAELIAAHPSEILRGMLEALDTGAADPWSITSNLHLFPPDVAEASAPAEMVAMRRRWDERPAPESSYSLERLRPSPSLRTLLQVPYCAGDLSMLKHASAYAEEVIELSPAAKAQLLECLDRWWPEGALDRGVRVIGPGRWRVNTGADAWLHYGPPLGAPLSPARWTAIATSERPLDDEVIPWLQDQHSSEAEHHCLAKPPASAYGWANLVRALPARVPEALLGVLERDWSPGGEEMRGAEWLARFLRERGHGASVIRLAQRDPALGHRLRFEVAASGDIVMQRRLLAELTRALLRWVHPHAVLEWVSTLSSPELLDALFDVLRACIATGLEGIGFHDVAGPIISAIRRIGGPDALRRYDELIRDHNQPFMRHRRDEIEQDLVGEASRASTAEIYGRLIAPEQ